MKISKGTIEISEIPYFDRIIVTSESITLEEDGVGPIDFSAEDVEAIRAALGAALDAHAEMNRVQAATESRTFGENDAEPPEGAKVRDRDGDIWTHASGRWRLGDNVPAWTWTELVATYGPLVEVREP